MVKERLRLNVLLLHYHFEIALTTYIALLVYAWLYTKLQHLKIVRAVIVKLQKHSDVPVPQLIAYSLGHIAHNSTNYLRYINHKHLSDRDCLLDLIIWFFNCCVISLK